MKYTDGSVPTDFVFRSSGDHTFLFATDETLSLQFDSSHTQSLMLRRDPDKLVLAYTQAMMGFKLFREDPTEILIFGLGGGSLSKYCYRRFQSSIVTTVEISQDVLALREEFKIPADNNRFRVVHADAGEYAAKSLPESVDVILFDAYDADGLPGHLNSKEFYRSCFNLLREDGVIAINLLDGDEDLRVSILRIADVFNNNCLIGYAQSCGNYIVLAKKGCSKLSDDVVTDVRRLIIKHRRNIIIPYFMTLADFFGDPMRNYATRA